VGQNAYIVYNYDYNASPDLASGVQAWFDEIKDYPADGKERILSTDVTKKCLFFFAAIKPYMESGTPATGHFTALVWAKTTKLGCGVASWYDSEATYPYQTVRRIQ